MKNSALLFEKIKYKEAVKYANSLDGVLINGVIHTDIIPHSIHLLVNEIISIKSVPIASIPGNSSSLFVANWVASILVNIENNRFFLNQMNWIGNFGLILIL